MSDVQNTPVPVTEASEATATATAITTDTTAPVVSEPKLETTTEAPAATATTEEAAPAAAATTADEVKEEKAVEPITEGQLAYKGPGLVKSLIPSKKEFWLNDEAVSPQHLDLFLRGEKPEIAHPVVAWASQTGKGLLFFNKKGESDRTHPADVLALYDATDLKKQSPHEFSFKLNGHNHTFKATSDAERDGWYQSIEKSIELGKASNEEVRNSEGYKAEIEKLNKPSTAVAAGAVRSQSKPKKSTEVADKADKTAERTGSSDGEVADKKKSRSTSRGMLNRFKGKKEELVERKEEKKEEKEAEKEEKKAEETGPVADSTEAAPVLASTAAADIPAAAEVAAAEPTIETPVAEEKAEKSKPAKRASIFGRVSSGWSGLKSPAKEKDAKDAELKPESKDAVVSENPPVLPETATAEPALETPAIPAVEEPTEAKVEVPKEEVATPSKEKGNFLSSFMKRNRSVSPSTHMKAEPVKKEETPIAAAEATPAEVVKAEEPATEDAAVETEAEKPLEKSEEPAAKTETPNKRQSVLGSLGRRASKALNRIQAPKKTEPTGVAATEAKKEETTEGAKAAEETPVVNGETKQTEEEAQKSIGDVVPEAVNVGQPQAQQNAPSVTASA